VGDDVEQAADLRLKASFLCRHVLKVPVNEGLRRYVQEEAMAQGSLRL
jgi:hypothetical protein